MADDPNNTVPDFAFKGATLANKCGVKPKGGLNAWLGNHYDVLGGSKNRIETAGSYLEQMQLLGYQRATGQITEMQYEAKFEEMANNEDVQNALSSGNEVSRGVAGVGNRLMYGAAGLAAGLYFGKGPIKNWNGVEGLNGDGAKIGVNGAAKGLVNIVPNVARFGSKVLLGAVGFVGGMAMGPKFGEMMADGASMVGGWFGMDEEKSGKVGNWIRSKLGAGHLNDPSLEAKDKLRAAAELGVRHAAETGVKKNELPKAEEPEKAKAQTKTEPTPAKTEPVKPTTGTNTDDRTNNVNQPKSAEPEKPVVDEATRLENRIRAMKNYRVEQGAAHGAAIDKALEEAYVEYEKLKPGSNPKAFEALPTDKFERLSAQAMVDIVQAHPGMTEAIFANVTEHGEKVLTKAMGDLGLSREATNRSVAATEPAVVAEVKNEIETTAVEAKPLEGAAREAALLEFRKHDEIARHANAQDTKQITDAIVARNQFAEKILGKPLSNDANLWAAELNTLANEANQVFHRRVPEEVTVMHGTGKGEPLPLINEAREEAVKNVVKCLHVVKNEKGDKSPAEIEIARAAMKTAVEAIRGGSVDDAALITSAEQIKDQYIVELTKKAAAGVHKTAEVTAEAPVIDKAALAEKLEAQNIGVDINALNDATISRLDALQKDMEKLGNRYDASAEKYRQEIKNEMQSIIAENSKGLAEEIAEAMAGINTQQIVVETTEQDKPAARNFDPDVVAAIKQEYKDFDTFPPELQAEVVTLQAELVNGEGKGNLSVAKQIREKIQATVVDIMSTSQAANNNSGPVVMDDYEMAARMRLATKLADLAAKNKQDIKAEGNVIALDGGRAGALISADKAQDIQNARKASVESN